MKIKLEFIDGILFCRLKGNLDIYHTYKINTYLLPLLIKHKIKYLVYNFYELDKIDNYGLEALLNTKCAIKSNKGKIMICEIPDEMLNDIKKLKIKRTESERTALQLIEV